MGCKEGSEGLGSLLVSIVVRFFVDHATNWLTYRPAENYNAKIFYQHVPGTPEYSGTINRVEFVRRSEGPVSCPT